MKDIQMHELSDWNKIIIDITKKLGSIETEIKYLCQKNKQTSIDAATAKELIQALRTDFEKFQKEITMKISWRATIVSVAASLGTLLAAIVVNHFIK